MKRVVQVKLTPTPAQAELLRDTLHACNAAACEVSKVARERGITNKRDLRQVTYGLAKSIVPGAQAAQSCIRKVADAYATHRANLRNGHYGKRGTEQRAKAEVKVIEFRPDAAQPYDDRILSWRHDAQMVSIWVADTGAGTPGRILVPFTGHPGQLKDLAEHRKGESDLLYRDGAFYLIATVDYPDVEPTLAGQPAGRDTVEGDWLGVDLGIVNIAYTSDGENWSGGAITHLRKKNRHIRRTAQARGTRSAKRLLKKRARRERRFASNVNHVISKHIVAEAKRTGRGIAMEDLTGIRARARHRKPQRATFHSWSFRQIGEYIAYKAAAAGVPVVFVDPAYTSQTCHECRHVDKQARNGEDYHCTNPVCGFVGHADHNGSHNIAWLAPATWAIAWDQAVRHAANDAA